MTYAEWRNTHYYIIRNFELSYCPRGGRFRTYSTRTRYLTLWRHKDQSAFWYKKTHYALMVEIEPDDPQFTIDASVIRHLRIKPFVSAKHIQPDDIVLDVIVLC